MERVYISKIEAFGETWKLTASDTGMLSFYPYNEAIIPRENEITRWAARELQEYLVHIRTEFSVPLDLRATPFQMRVWQALRQVPYGSTKTYGQIAADIGSPKAVRAVGQAIGRNPCLILVPCHRIIGKSGALTGFSAGMERKKRLLDLEGIPY